MNVDFGFFPHISGEEGNYSAVLLLLVLGRNQTPFLLLCSSIIKKKKPTNAIPVFLQKQK